MTSDLRRRLGDLAPARASLRARLLAAGFGGGGHRAERRGSGVEFAEHREYVPGDDLRHLDRHALLRHGRHLIREFHTETERALWIVVDASPSMCFRSEDAPDSKRGMALLLAAGLSSLARRAGDPLGLSLVRTGGNLSLRPRLGSDHFERVLGILEDEDEAPEGPRAPVDFGAALDDVGRRAARGASVIVLSDLLERSKALKSQLASLCTRRRNVTVVQILDPHEVTFPYRGAVRLQDPESALVVDTDAERVREGYLDALDALTRELGLALREQGGALLRVRSDDPPGTALRHIQASLAGSPRGEGGNVWGSA